MTTPATAAISRQESIPQGRDDAHDAALVNRIARGDRAAFEALYRDYHPRLTRFLGRLTRRRELVEEIVNDTLWVVWNKAGAFRGSSRVSTWVMGIAYRRGLTSLSRAGAEPQEYTQVHDGQTGREPFAQEETREWVARGLRHLPLEQRTTLELAYYVGHSLEEIAEIMQCPLGTVKARMFRARIRLRNLLPALGGAGPEEP